MVDSAAEFRKNGFNDEDAAQLARISSMFQNVADETISAGDSAQFLISQLIAFNQTGGDVEANAIHIADSLNEVANQFAVGTGDLATGLKVVASSSAGMGNSLEETIGLLVSITEQTKNASKSARSVNAIMSNLAQVLDEGSSNGKKITEIFEDLGLQMYDTNGQLKSGFDLLKELNSKWNTLDGNTQKYIATTIAGTTQLNGFLALMNNFGHAVDATDTALNSQGSAIQENDRYMESISAKLAQLNSTFQDFANNVIGSDLVKVLLDIANGLLKIANTPLGQVVTQITLLSAIGWGATSLVNALGIFQTVSGQFYNFARMLKDVAFAASAAQGPLAGVAAEGLTLTTVLGGILPVIGLVAGALVVGGYLWKATEDYRKSFSELSTEIEDSTSRLETNKKRLEEINNLSWDEKTPAIDNERKALEKENEELEKQIKKLSKLKDAKESTALDGTVTEKRYTVTDATGKYGKYSDLLTNVDFSSYEELEKYLGERIPEAAGKTKEQLESMGITLGVVERTVYKTGEAYQSALIDKAHDLTASLLSGKTSAEKQKEAYEETISTLTEYADKQDALGVSSDDTRDAIDRLTNAFEINSAVTGEAIGQMAVASSEAEKLKAKYPQLASALQNVNGVYYLNVDALKAVTGATKEEVAEMYNAVAATIAFNNQAIDGTQKLAVLKQIAAAAGVTQDLLSGFGSSEARYNQSLRRLTNQGMKMEDASNQILSGLWNKWMSTVDFSSKVTPKTSPTPTGSTTSASKARSSAAKSTQKEETAEEKLAKAIKATNEAYNEQISILENRMYILEQQAPEDPLASEEALNQYKSIQEQKIAYYKQMQQETHDLAEQYRKLGVAEESSTLTDLGKKWWQYQKEIKDVYASISDYTDKFADKLKEKAEEVRQKAIEEAEAMREAQKEALEKQKSDYETAISYVISKIDDEIDKLQNLRDETEKYWDNKIQALQDANDELDKQIEREELLDALAKARNKKVYAFVNGQFQYIQDTEAVSAAQANLDAYDRERALTQEVKNLNKLKDEALAAIDKQIEGWEKYRDEWSKVTTQYTNQQNKLIAEQVLGVDLEQKNWEKRLSNVQSFADKYNAILASLKSIQEGTIIGDAAYTPGAGGVGSSGMSDADKRALAKAGEDYNNAKTDEDRRKAHARAEAIRAKYGYSGGVTGSEYIPTGGSSSGGGGSSNKGSSSSNKTSSTSTNKGSSSSRPSQDIGGRANNPGRYAEGTLNARGGLSIVGEKGPELRVLNNGDGILPNSITKNLWDWGKINPSSFSGNNVTNMTVSNVTLPNVKNAEDFVAGLKNLAMQRSFKR